jgi:anti-sigma B factor antagonist
MEIIKTLKNGMLTIALDGKMDITTAPDLEKEVADLDGVKELIMDFEKLRYISSAGLRVLLLAHKKMIKQGGTMKVIHVNENVMEVMTAMGFADILTVE